MGREVRMIKPGWKHPTHSDTHYDPSRRGQPIPLLKGDFATADADWSEGWAKWQEGLRENYGPGEKWVPIDPEYRALRYTDYSGPRPSPDDYMPTWAPGEATLYVMYENTSEGTPISPPFETPEELARWLVDNEASAFAGQTASYEAWLRVAHGGYAPSAVMSKDGLQSGVEAVAQ